MVNSILLLAGIALLTVGGDILIRGALASARRLNISPLLTGLVIVGFGTSAPELVVSIEAAISQQPDLAVGNVVGSNIGNILLILGLCALLSPLHVTPLVLRRDATTVVASSILFFLLALTGVIVWFQGGLLLLFFVAYLVWAYKTEKKPGSPVSDLRQAEAAEVSRLPESTVMILLCIFLGLGLLIGGSKVLLIGATGIAQSLHVSDAVIGLTVVAVGTSLPELSVSVLAALRKHADVAVGNILGSNIFNMLAILGISSILQPLPLHARIMQFDQWVLVATSFVLMVFLYTGRRLSRWEGSFLLTAYVIYLALSFMQFGS